MHSSEHEAHESLWQNSGLFDLAHCDQRDDFVNPG